MTWASGGTYNAAGQLIGVERLQSVSGCAPAAPQYFNQAWQYNSLNQLTEIDTSTQTNGYPNGSPNPGVATYFFAKYAFSGTANNGQIVTAQDARTGNTVSYQYDLLKRVTSAKVVGNSGQNQTFVYDGFSNLVSKSVPSGSSEFVLPGVNAAKNWLNGSTYDANGNVTTLNNATLAYDMENRLSSYTTGTFVESYAYDEGNRRVEKWNTSGADNVYLYSPSGKLLTVVHVNVLQSSPWMTFSTVSNRIYFGGMLLGTSTGYAVGDSDVIKDRLGSAKPSYAYGTDIGTQAGEGDDFATYWKDFNTGLQYAMNRYYSARYGRFLTVDPDGGSPSLEVPETFNSYAYSGGDPVNRHDPLGLCADLIAGITMNPVAGPFATVAESLGADSAYPFAGENIRQSLGAVISHAADSTAAAYSSLLYALNTNPGLIDVGAYSGGAQAFTSAYKELTTEQQNRIGLVLYISPGANGPIEIIPGLTTVEEGTGGVDDLAMLGTQFPASVNPVFTSCVHTDLACLFRNAPSVLAAIANNGPCDNPQSFARVPEHSGGGGGPLRMRVPGDNNSDNGSGGGGGGPWGGQWPSLPHLPWIYWGF